MQDQQGRKTLLFAGAHPDDESFGPGGTLARYAAEGARVVYVCATRGEAGVAEPQFLTGHATPGDMRSAELACAAHELGLAEVIHLGYRDSGMPGTADNSHPESLVSAPLEQVTAQMVRILREVRPQVVITHDPIGGYRHPDHIALHNATLRAFHAAGDPAQFPDQGPAYTPQKLYYHVFPRGFFKLALRIMPLFGQDPRRFGRNQDIDLVSLAEVDFPVHARIRVRGEAAERKQRAAACHGSQLDIGSRSARLWGLWARLRGSEDTFMRAHPPVANGSLREWDLFEGVA